MTTTQPLVTGVDFVPVPIRDLDRAIEFYGEKLGLPCSVHRPDRGFAEFETGNLTLSLVSFERMGMEHHVNRNAIALHVDEIESARAQLEAAGVEFMGDTFDTGVCHMAFFSRSRRERPDAPPSLHPARDRRLTDACRAARTTGRALPRACVGRVVGVTGGPVREAARAPRPGSRPRPPARDLGRPQWPEPWARPSVKPAANESPHP